MPKFHKEIRKNEFLRFFFKLYLLLGVSPPLTSHLYQTRVFNVFFIELVLKKGVYILSVFGYTCMFVIQTRSTAQEELFMTTEMETETGRRSLNPF